MIKVSKRLVEVFDLETIVLRQNVHDDLQGAEAGVQKSHVYIFEVVEKSLSLIFRHAKQNASAKPGSSSAHAASCRPRVGYTGAVRDSIGVAKGDAPRSFKLASLDAMGSRNYLKQYSS